MRAVGDERGIVAVLVVLMMVFLVGFAALAIDVASLYQERRTLQNGADAGALSVAKDCAGTGCVASQANSLADSNADDTKSNVDEVCGTGPGLPACATPPSVPAGAKYVKVTTSTKDAAGGANPSQVNFRFAPVLDIVDPGHSAQHRGQTVRASAVAAWGSPAPAGATTLPLTLSICEYKAAVPTPASLQTGPPFTGDAAVIYFHGSTTCGAGPAGTDVPGGFGWLSPNNDCEVVIPADGWVYDKPGNSVVGCIDYAALQNAVVQLPIYDDVDGNGSNGKYHIIGFAALYLTGYKFNGNNRWPSTMSCPGTSGNSATCIQGYWTRFTTTGTTFGGPDMGVTIFKLVG